MREHERGGAGSGRRQAAGRRGRQLLACASFRQSAPCIATPAIPRAGWRRGSAKPPGGAQARAAPLACSSGDRSDGGAAGCQGFLLSSGIAAGEPLPIARPAAVTRPFAALRAQSWGGAIVNSNAGRAPMRLMGQAGVGDYLNAACRRLKSTWGSAAGSATTGRVPGRVPSICEWELHATAAAFRCQVSTAADTTTPACTLPHDSWRLSSAWAGVATQTRAHHNRLAAQRYALDKPSPPLVSRLPGRTTPVAILLPCMY